MALRKRESWFRTPNLVQKKVQISITTLNRWRRKYSQMDETDAKRLQALKETIEKKSYERGAAIAIQGPPILLSKR